MYHFLLFMSLVYINLHVSQYVHALQYITTIPSGKPTIYLNTGMIKMLRIKIDGSFSTVFLESFVFSLLQILPFLVTPMTHVHVVSVFLFCNRNLWKIKLRAYSIDLPCLRDSSLLSIPLPSILAYSLEYHTFSSVLAGIGWNQQ